jgi:ferredoxin
MMTLTLAVKNMFGTVVGAAKPGWHLQTADQSRFADMLLDIWRALPPRLNILDGITAMEGNGPSSGDPVDLGLLLTSPSALALDQVAGEIAGVPPERHPVLHRARERGIEGSEPAHVRIAGVDVREAAQAIVLPSSVPRVDYRLPVWLKRGLRRSLNTYPELAGKRCVSCGQCAGVCPVNAITLYDQNRGGGNVNIKKCINCFCCQEVCPEGAIDLVSGRLLQLLKRIGAA